VFVIIDPNHGLRVASPGPALVNGKKALGREEILPQLLLKSTMGSLISTGAEGIVHVGVFSLGGRDNGHFAGSGDRLLPTRRWAFFLVRASEDDRMTFPLDSVSAGKSFL